MSTSEINNKIRDFVNDSVIKKTNIFSKKTDGDWNQFWGAVDTIEDTCLAIESFQQDSSDLFVKNPYLGTYGILQALYIQQDAVSYLKTILFGSSKKIDWNNNKYLELRKIRRLRNETIGHPVKTNKKGKESEYSNNEITSCAIERSSLSKDGFSYTLWTHSGPDRNNIKFSDIIELQNNKLSTELETILKELQKEEKQHKLKFRGNKLADLLNYKSLYQISLIYGVRWDDHLAWPSFDHYYNQYKKIRSGLEERYGKFGSLLRIQGTELLIKKLDYIFAKLEVFKNTGKFNEYEFEIHVDALDAGLNEIKTHLEEIDKEFQI